MDLAEGRRLSVGEVASLLSEARSRTLLLVTGLDDSDLVLQHDTLMSPIVWDLGHIAHFEEVWLIENIESTGSGGEGLRGVYDPFENPRATRGELPLPDPGAVTSRMARVRGRVLRNLRGVDVESTAPLLADGFVFRMVLQHEYQHGETILQTLQLKRGDPFRAPRAILYEELDPGVSAPDPEAMVRFPGGTVSIGTDDRSAAYDNERPRHDVELEPFRIDVTPVTGGRYLDFMEDGGYRNRALWSPEGWAWREETGARAPKYWFEEDGAWRVRVMDLERDADPKRPVCHVCYHEADAYARWAGKRLPTEFEWEAAASWDPSTGGCRRYPWGDEAPTPDLANLDWLAFDTAPVGTFERNVSPLGCYGMIGDVWEWTSTDFRGYPGFHAFPYREYSEVFFGDEYKVLRGGAWATRPGAIRTTFRNWDYPIRRQIFAGFRCASDG